MNASRARAIVACVVFFLMATAGSALAQGAGVGPGARIRVTVSGALLARDLIAMADAEGAASGAPTDARLIAIRTRDGQDLVLPAPGSSFAGILVALP